MRGPENHLTSKTACEIHDIQVVVNEEFGISCSK